MLPHEASALPWSASPSSIRPGHAGRAVLANRDPGRRLNSMTLGRRTRAATAAFLSSMFPGLGQAYNRHWLKAATMFALTIVLVLGVRSAFASMLGAAATVQPLATGAAFDDDTLRLQLLAALTHPAVQSCARRFLLPPVLGLCALVIWSVVDAYRHARR